MAHAAVSSPTETTGKSAAGKALGIIAWVALVAIAVSFVLKYVFHYYLNCNPTAFEPYWPRRAVVCCSTSPEAWSPCSPVLGSSFRTDREAHERPPVHRADFSSRRHGRRNRRDIPSLHHHVRMGVRFRNPRLGCGMGINHRHGVPGHPQRLGANS